MSDDAKPVTQAEIDAALEWPPGEDCFVVIRRLAAERDRLRRRVDTLLAIVNTPGVSDIILESTP